VLLITIDGDGFIYRDRDTDRPVGALILEEVLTRYPFKFSASFIAGEMLQYADSFDADLAARILALENVEAASHSWSHPHDWESAAVDTETEVVRSVRFIEDALLRDGKRVKTFFWTGQSNPSAAALRAVARLGIGNLNGGDPTRAYEEKGGHRHYMSRAANDWTYMDLERLIVQAKAGPVYDFLKSHPGRLDGFRKVIEFFAAHPELPIHVYFHWYSAVRRDSLDALKEVLDWCVQQNCRPVFASEYIETLGAPESRGPESTAKSVVPKESHPRIYQPRLKAEPVFVCGLSRSGTTWLASALGQSPELVYLQEAWLLDKLAELVEWFSMLHDEWGGFTPWRKHGIDREAFVQQLAGFYENLLFQASAGRRFVEKTPEANLLRFELLHELFPSAYYVLIYRDGRNQVASLEAMKREQGEPFDFEETCRRWARGMEVVSRAQRHLSIEHLTILRYEDLLERFAPIFDELCRFAGLEPFELGPRAPNSSFGRARGPADFKHRWDAWPEEKKATFKRLAGEQLIAWRYVDSNAW
jgi:hypothetical protein